MTTLITNSQFKQFDGNGVPLAYGKIYTYIVGTTTDKVTYQDADKIAAHTNPIILDAWGESTIWIDGDTKFVVTDSDDVTIRTYDSFSDTQTTGEFPVVSSPLGGVYRSEATDIGYLKIQLPMGEWPNTKMMFDVMIYTDDADEAFTLTLGGYADSNTSAWLTTTAITNGITDYTVQFGNDGTYPAIYIGAVGTNWVKPQVAVTNFFAGQFSYDWATWDNGWAVSVTTSLGTITGTPTVYRKLELASDAETITGTDDTKSTSPKGVKAAIDALELGWGAWVAVTYLNGWAASTAAGTVGIKYRLSTDSQNLQVVGSTVETGSIDSHVFTAPAGHTPAVQIRGNASASQVGANLSCSILANGEFYISNFTAGTSYSINEIFPLDLS